MQVDAAVSILQNCNFIKKMLTSSKKVLRKTLPVHVLVVFIRPENFIFYIFSFMFCMQLYEAHLT